MIFSSSVDGFSKIWSLTYYKCLKRISNDQTPIKSQIYLDNQILMTYNHSAILRSIETDEVIMQFSGHSANVNSILTFKDLVITGSDDATIRIYDKLSSQTLRTLIEHECSVLFLKIMYSFKLKEYLLVSADSINLKLWCMNSGKCYNTYYTGNKITYLSTSNYELLFIGLIDGSVQVVSYDFNKPILNFKAHDKSITVIESINKDNFSLKFITASNKFVKMWDGQECFKTIELDDIVSSLYVNINILVIGLVNGQIKIYEILNFKLLKTFKGHSSEITSIELKMNFDRKMYTKYLLNDFKNEEFDQDVLQNQMKSKDTDFNMWD